MEYEIIGKVIYFLDDNSTLQRFKNGGIITRYILPSDKDSLYTVPYFEIKEYNKKYHSTNCYTMSKTNLERFIKEGFCKLKNQRKVKCSLN
jgi:hypothetical protein